MRGETRPPSRASWRRNIERLAPGALPLADRIIAAPARPGEAVNLADLDPDEARQLHMLRRLGCVRIFASGDLGRWRISTTSLRIGDHQVDQHQHDTA